MDEVGDNEGKVRKGEGGGQRAHILYAESSTHTLGVCMHLPKISRLFSVIQYTHTDQSNPEVRSGGFDLYVNLRVHTRKHMYT